MFTASNVKKTYPGREWSVADPAQFSFSHKQLQTAAQAIGGNGCIIVKGRLVMTWGKWNQPNDIASAAKVTYAHLLFKALELGLIPSLDSPVMKWEPRLATINKKLNYKDSKITWRHLGNQASCYGLSDMPGSAFAYNDCSMALFVDTLFNKVYKRSVGQWDADIFNKYIASPLQMQDRPSLLAFGKDDRPGRLAISPRDFARFGYLYLHEGLWKDQRIISPGCVQMALHNPLPLTMPRTSHLEAEMLPRQRSIGSLSIPDDQTDHDSSYSWMWWLNGITRDKHRKWPALPHDAFAADGHWGAEGLLVLPSHDVVVSWNSSPRPAGMFSAEASEALMEAIAPLNVTADTLHTVKGNKAWLSRSAQKTSIICGPGDPEGFLYRGMRNPDGTRSGDQLDLIHKMAGTRANCIYMIAVRSHGGDGDKTQNPFINNDPSKELNNKLLDQWETWFKLMDELGIIIYLFIYDDSARVWSTGDTVGPEEQRFIQQIVTRFKHHKNLVWCLAEEYQEVLTPLRAKRIAALIRSIDGIHSIAVHKLQGATFKEFAGDPSIDQYAVQYNTDSEKELHNALVSCWKEAAGRWYINMSECANFGNREAARYKLWSCITAGASAMVLDMDIASTSLDDLYDCGRVVSFMESINGVGLQPADSQMSLGTTHAMTNKEGQYLLYGKNHKSRMGIKGALPGTYELVWFDCATGLWCVQPNLKLTSTSAVWTVPSVIGSEAVLYARLLR